MFEAVEALDKAAQEMKRSLRVEGEAAIKDMFRSFFEAYPSVRAVRWTQYTPHFNDGEACVFSVNEAQLAFHAEANDGGTLARWFDYWDLREQGSQVNEDFSKLNQLLQSDTLAFILDAAFGDGYEVTATREAITAEHYDHD